MLVERGTILSRISWVGIVAGLVVGIVTQLALTLLGVAVGAATIDTLNGLAWSTIIWLAISLAISAFLAGLTAARAAGYLTPAQGRFNGLITGSLLVLGLTTFSYNALLSGVNSALGIVSSVGTAVAGATTAAGTAAANGGALQSDPVQALLGGLNENNITQIIAQNAPNLNQTQVQAAANVVTGIANRAANTIGNNLSNITNLPSLINSRVKSIQTALSGPQFVTRLQRQGLTQAQAQETANSITTLVNDTVTQAQQTAAAAAQIARNAAVTAGWVWLLAAGFILLFSVWGGHIGNDVPQGGATMLPNRDDDVARRT